MSEHLGWHSRGVLPHFDPGQVMQSVNFRLVDSLPKEKLLELQANTGKGDHAALREKVESWLDQGAGSCLLRHQDCARIVEETLFRDDGQRYRLLAWCVMPNHVHTLFLVLQGCPLHKTMQAIKAFSALRINKLLGRSGRLWQPEYFDRVIRDERHFTDVVEYIEYNPVAAGLCRRPEDWPFSSAGWRVGQGVKPGIPQM